MRSKVSGRPPTAGRSLPASRRARPQDGVLPGRLDALHLSAGDVAEDVIGRLVLLACRILMEIVPSHRPDLLVVELERQLISSVTIRCVSQTLPQACP